MANTKIRFDKRLQLDSSLSNLVNNYKISIDSNNIVELTNNNSKIVEDLIKKDPNYCGFTQMVYKELRLQTKSKILNNDKLAWTAFVRIIDIENSTQVWKFSRNEFYKLIYFIIDPSNNFIKRLKKGDPSLVCDLQSSISTKKI